MWQVGWARRLGRVIKVVDGPGVCETRLARGDAADKLVGDMAQGILQCPHGFHALVLVLRYGVRFTEEELHVVQSLKELFGENFLRDHCIIIFTHGDQFDFKYRKNPKSFKEWCEGLDSLFWKISECTLLT